jgi:curved DNA-binding protein CbpA
MDATDVDSYYDVLAIDEDASADEIVQAYYQRLREVNANTEPDRYDLLQEAYRVLSDPDEREWYDEIGHAQYVGRE